MSTFSVKPDLELDDSEPHFVVDVPESSLKFAHYLGSVLKVIRVEKRILQSELAARLSAETHEVVAQSYISRMEKGPSQEGGVGLSFARFTLLCKVLGCRPSEVVKDAEALAAKAALDPGCVHEALLTACDEQLHSRKEVDHGPC